MILRIIGHLGEKQISQIAIGRDRNPLLDTTGVPSSLRLTTKSISRNTTHTLRPATHRQVPRLPHTRQSYPLQVGVGSPVAL